MDWANNNPGNIPHSKIQWVGKSLDQPDPNVVRFINIFYGVRNLGKILLKCQTKMNIKTVHGLVSFLKQGTVDTHAYARRVADYMGIADPWKQPIDLFTRTTMIAMIAAIAKVESNSDILPFDDTDIARGVAMIY